MPNGKGIILKVEFVCINSPTQLETHPRDPDLFDWFNENGDVSSSTQLEFSIEYVFNYIKKNGRFDVLLGLSVSHFLYFV